MSSLCTSPTSEKSFFHRKGSSAPERKPRGAYAKNRSWLKLFWLVFGLVLAEADEFDARHRRAVAYAVAHLEDARVAAGALGICWRDLREELLHDGVVAQFREGKTAYRRCDDCEHEGECGVRLALRQAYLASLAILEKTSLEDTLEMMAESHEGIVAMPMYNI